MKNKRSAAKEQPTEIFWWAGVFAILALAAILRFVNLDHNPGWYPDEGTQILVAQSFLAGNRDYLGLRDSLVLIARQPLYPWVLSLLIPLFNHNEILALRSMSALLGVITTGVLTQLPGRLAVRAPRRLGLAAGLLYAVLPFAVLYNRLGFSYNASALLLLFVFLGLYRYGLEAEYSALLIACSLAGLGALVDFWFIPVILICWIVILWKNRRHFLIGLVVTLAPLSLYFALQWLAAPDAFLFDLAYTISRIRFPVLTQVGMVVMNYGLLIFDKVWVALGIAGMFLFREARVRYALLSFFGLVFLFVARTSALVGLGGYQFLPVVPLLMLGFARFVLTAWETISVQVLSATRSTRLGAGKSRQAAMPAAWIAGFLVLGTPLLVSLTTTIGQLRSGIASEIEPVLMDPMNARLAAAFVNERAAADDLVIASPALAWLIEANVTDYQISLAFDGLESRHFPTDIPRDRFLFDVSIRNARYVIVDRTIENWAAANVPDIATILERTTQRPPVAQFGEFRIYEQDGE